MAEKLHVRFMYGALKMDLSVMGALNRMFGRLEALSWAACVWDVNPNTETQTEKLYV